MALILALALVPNALVTSDLTLDSAPLVPPDPITLAMLAEPGLSSSPGIEPPPPRPPLPPAPPESPTAQVGMPAAVVIAKKHHAPGDPLEGFNRASYKFSTGIDKAVLRPVALAYRHIVPRPARDGLRNLLSNIGEPFVFANDMLQLKIGRAIKTLGRFVINSTLGVVGLFDTAKRKPFHLPHHNNSLGDTLGFYGVGPGPYLYLPILGPTTLRDAVAGQLQGMALGVIVRTPLRTPEYQIPAAIIGGLDQRAEADDDLRVITDDSVDPYATLRSVVLQDRAGEIAGLKAGTLDDPTRDPLLIPADPILDDPLQDPAAPVVPAAPQPAPAPAPTP